MQMVVVEVMVVVGLVVEVLCHYGDHNTLNAKIQ